MTAMMTMKKQQEQAQKHACAERVLVMPFRIVAGMMMYGMGSREILYGMTGD